MFVTAETKAAALEMYQRPGVSQKAVAEAFGVSKRTVVRWMREAEAGVQPTGSKHAGAAERAAQEKIAARMCAAGETPRNIGLAIGVSEGTARRRAAAGGAVMRPVGDTHAAAAAKRAAQAQE